jgi:hypothetical protein
MNDAHNRRLKVSVLLLAVLFVSFGVLATPHRPKAKQNKEPEKESKMFDMKNLGKLKKLDENAPEAMNAFWAFEKETFKEVL